MKWRIRTRKKLSLSFGESILIVRTSVNAVNRISACQRSDLPRDDISEVSNTKSIEYKTLLVQQNPFTVSRARAIDVDV